MRLVRVFFEVGVLSALILFTRCANYQDIFVAGGIYFVDADCYARMTRVRTIAAHPGTIVRHHDFENYPIGTTPHTTAPLDYAIAALAAALQSATKQPLDLAGAIISPLLALAGGWFLWWWSRRLASPYRWAALLLYALSPILAHGTALGRPDHQAPLIVLVLVALAAEWELLVRPSRRWAIVSGCSWGMALWISFYEPLLLLAALLVFHAVRSRSQLTAAAPRRLGWYVAGAIVLLALVVERRWPQFPITAVGSSFQQWSATVGELKSVSLTNPIWLYWCGGLIVLAPFLCILAVRRGSVPAVFGLLLGLTFLLTIWQARWGYFAALVFALTIPAQLGVVRRRWLCWLLVAVGFSPVLQSWHEQIWPNDEKFAAEIQNRREMVELRAAANSLGGTSGESLLAPWWLTPAAVYCSGQPGVAGSSHESLAGIVDSARFFLATQPNDAAEILRRRQVRWVLAYDAGRVTQNSAAILGIAPPKKPLCLTLDRLPSQAPPFLKLTNQNGTCKVYEVVR